jgi:hypothetical protein
VTQRFDWPEQYHRAVNAAVALAMSDAELAPLVQYVPGARVPADVRRAAERAEKEGRAWIPPCDYAGSSGLCRGHSLRHPREDTWGT